MRRLLILALIAVAGCATALPPSNHVRSIPAVKVAEEVVSQSVGVESWAKDKSNGMGTGVVLESGYVLSCAHLFLKEIDKPELKPGLIGAKITVHRWYRGKHSETKFDATIEKIDHVYDLALLRVKGDKNVFPNAVEFYEGELPIGTPIYSVGCPISEGYAMTLASGIVSHPSRENGKFFQGDIAVTGGCSGGGVFLQSDGRYVGQQQRKQTENMALICPTSKIREWARNAGVEPLIFPR